MAIKVFAILLIAITTYSVAIPVEYPDGTVVKNGIISPQYKEVDYESEHPANYNYGYSVHDEHTGDIKSQQESRKGNLVQGRYELIDPDGYRRIVEYSVDEHSGFNAVVHREPTDIKIPQPIPRVRKLVTSIPTEFTAPAGKLAPPPANLNHHSVQQHF